MTRALITQMLEALDASIYTAGMNKQTSSAITAAREWLAAPEQSEPVAWRVWIGDPTGLQYIYSEDGDGEPLYTAAPQPTKLTESDIRTEFGKLYPNDIGILALAENNRDYALEAIGARHHWAAFLAGARAVLAAQKAKV
jgi:hypothetical protein